MRRFASTSAVFLALLASAPPANALEKTPARWADEGRPASAWRAGLTCTVAYYNLCTGWVWIWSDFEPGERIGEIVDNCAAPYGELLASGVHTWTGSPSGYGFTGTVSIHSVDEQRCPELPAFGSQPFLPVSGWNTYLWGVFVDDDFAIVAELGPGANNPVGFTSDHPAVGPAGPIPCGTCYPTTREGHSFFWGTAASPLCPGSTLFDGSCDAQLVAFTFLQGIPVSVEETSWGAIKALYR